jgi:hypothetical protein
LCLNQPASRCASTLSGSIKIKKYIAELVKFQVNILSVMNDIGIFGLFRKNIWREVFAWVGFLSRLARESMMIFIQSQREFVGFI